MAVSPFTLAKAKAISLGIRGMIGEEPAIITYDDYVEIDFTEEQRRKLIAYFDTHVQKLFRGGPTDAPELQVRFGKVLIPWGVRYLAPVMFGVFAMGFMSRAVLYGGKR